MPIYEYRCTACGHELEALQKLSEPPLSSCPSCRAETLTKLVSAAGFQLKGSGWYQTDFRGGGSKPAAASTEGKSDGGAKTDGGSKSDGGGKSEAAASSTPATGCGGSCACH